MKNNPFPSLNVVTLLLDPVCPSKAALIPMWVATLASWATESGPNISVGTEASSAGDPGWEAEEEEKTVGVEEPEELDELEVRDSLSDSSLTP